VPKIPAEYTGAGYGSDSDFSDDDQEEPAPLERKTSGRKSALPPLEELGFHIDMGDLTQEFDRVIEAQKANTPLFFDTYDAFNDCHGFNDNAVLLRSRSNSTFEGNCTPRSESAASFRDTATQFESDANTRVQRGYLMRQ